jgi:hypothetical protein
MAVALTSAAILPLSLVLPGVAAPPKPKITFSSQKLSAGTVASGGSVTASIVVKPTGGATVSSVTLRVVKSGAPSTTSAMSQSGTRWSKAFTAPSNTSGKTASVDVWADAQTSLGAKSSKIGTLKVKTGTIDPNSPPPPPPI